MTIEQKHNGIVIYDIIGGYLFHRLYVGYTRKEAAALFFEEAKAEVK